MSGYVIKICVKVWFFLFLIKKNETFLCCNFVLIYKNWRNIFITAIKVSIYQLKLKSFESLLKYLHSSRIRNENGSYKPLYEVIETGKYPLNLNLNKIITIRNRWNICSYHLFRKRKWHRTVDYERRWSRACGRKWQHAVNVGN